MDLSIIVPLYHGNDYINEMINQLNNALINTELNAELILVNDSPETPIGDYIVSDKLQLVIIETGKNLGIHGARVKGFEASKGIFIQFLDQDDLINSMYFIEQLKGIVGYDASVCADINGNRCEFVCDRYKAGKISLQGMITEGNYLRSPGQVLIRRDSIPEIWLKTRLRNNGADDWFLWILMLKQGRRFNVIRKKLFTHVLHDHNTSFKSLEMHKSEQELIDIIGRSGVLSKEELKSLNVLLYEQNIKRLREGDIAEKKAQIYRKICLFNISNRNPYKNIVSYLNNGVYIYGYGELGRFLCEELTTRGIDVVGFIDRDADLFVSNQRIVHPGSELCDCGAIIVSVLSGTDIIVKELKEQYKVGIYCIDEIVGDIS